MLRRPCVVLAFSYALSYLDMLVPVFPIRFNLPPRPYLRRVYLQGASLLVGLLALGMASCSRSGGPASSATMGHSQPQASQQARAAQDSARQELDQIPPPSKSLYLAVHSQEGWANPFVIVDADMLTLQIVLPDANPSPLGQGGLLRPVSARKQTLQIHIAELPKALTALPAEAWPYGRVVATAEAATTNRTARPAIRRKMETTIQMLNDLGIVVDEWAGPSGGLLR